MRQALVGITIGAAVLLRAGVAAAADPPARPPMTCPVDAVASGNTCMDKYEASVWRVPDADHRNKALVAKIRSGTVDGGGPDDGRRDAARPGRRRLCAVRGQRPELRERHLRGEPAGNDAVGVHHVVPGPAGMQERGQASADQRGVAGGGGGYTGSGTRQRDDGLQHGTARFRRWTPGPAAAASRRGVRSTWWAICRSGSRSGCRDRRCAEPGAPTSARRCDLQCLAGATAAAGPGALLRGGGFFSGSAAGPLAIDGSIEPSGSDGAIGFRCAR